MLLGICWARRGKFRTAMMFKIAIEKTRLVMVTQMGARSKTHSFQKSAFDSRIDSTLEANLEKGAC